MNFKTYVSGCCGAAETDTRNTDTGFCPDCGEHTTFVPTNEYFEDEARDMSINSLIASTTRHAPTSLGDIALAVVLMLTVLSLGIYTSNKADASLQKHYPEMVGEATQ